MFSLKTRHASSYGFQKPTNTKPTNFLFQKTKFLPKLNIAPLSIKGSVMQT